MSPSITSFTPHAQIPGGPVVITGVNFTGTISVVFGTDDALNFNVDSDTQITAYPNISGDDSITVTNLDGQDTVSGFTKIIVKVKIKDLPELGRDVSDTDLAYIWDSVRDILCQATGSQLPSGTGGGTGGGITQTQLGSPFKVRNTDVNYSDDGTDTTITDLRLVGKKDYIVYSTDFNQEFENYLSDAATATETGITSASDGTYTDLPSLTTSGIGKGSIWDVVVLSGSIVSITLNTGGAGYEIGDTFVLDDIPGAGFTVSSLGTNFTGNLLYNDTDGILTIKNYTLTDQRHISIYADGVVSSSQNSFTAKMAVYDKVLAPIIGTLASNSKSGVIWPWRLPASLIPTGWQECTDFRGKFPVGQDTTDIYDPTTNQNGLSQAINTPVGANHYVLQRVNLPAEGLKLPTQHGGINLAGGSTYVALSQGGGVPTSISENMGSGTAMSMLSGARIVEWIEFVG